MNNTVKIGVISDLHCTYSSDYKSQDTILFSNTLKNGNRKNQVNELLTYLKKNNICADYLLCPGDITNKIDIQGLISGFGYLKEIQTTLGAHQLICTPGNHDVDYLHSKTGVLEKADDSIKHLDNDHYPLSNAFYSNSLLNDGFCVYTDDTLAILCINSVHNFTDEENAKSVFIPPKTLDSIEKELINIPMNINIRMVLIHHHPFSYTDLNYRSYGKQDYIENGDELLELIHKYDFGLLIHGHKHKARLITHQSVTIFCAGGFSALQNLQNGDNENTFHIIEIDPRFPKKGTIRTWSYSQSAGWKKPSCDFPHITGFGSTANIKNLAHEIANQFDDLRDGKEIIPFQKVKDKFPEISFIHYKEFENLQNELRQLHLFYTKSNDDSEFLIHQD